MTKVFNDRPVGPDVAEKILHATNKGPSAGFSQGHAFLTLEEPVQRAASSMALNCPSTPKHVRRCSGKLFATA
jgi:hypothetical protein